VVTLYPSSEVVSVQHVFSNGDKASRMHVSRSGDNLVVSGVRTGENVRLYQANGTVLARKTAGEDGKAVFPMMQRRGVVLISSGNETVKFAY
jgi:glutamate synthase domain-containing protein 3